MRPHWQEFEDPLVRLARQVSSAVVFNLRRVSDDERLIGEIEDPDGRTVVLLARIWEGKIVCDHPELRDHAKAVLGTVASPDHVESDPRAGRQRYYRRRIGPSRWLLVVVSFEQEPGRIITALASRKDPKRWKS